MVRELFTERHITRMHGIILWVPMLQGDDLTAGQRQAGSWQEERVQQWWDGDKEISELWQRTLGLREPAWDVYLLYPSHVRWEGEVPPAPAFWMHQLSDPAAADDRLLCRNPARLACELAMLLEE